MADAKDFKQSASKRKRSSSGNQSKNSKKKRRDKGQEMEGEGVKVKKTSKEVRKGKKVKSQIKMTVPNGGDGAPQEVWSKSKKKRMRQLRAKRKIQEPEEPSTGAGPDEAAASPPGKTQKKKDERQESSGNNTTEADQLDMKGASSSLQKSYAARLSGSRFRILNEELYTTSSASAFENFQSNPELFDQYHEGFRHQVKEWPSNPVDVMFQWLSKKYANSAKPTVVADFGCGDAELAKRLLKMTKRKGVVPFLVHSFDLIAKSDLVTACDMADVPLKDKTVDVAIFCLALMGTNVADFLVEAHRVLKDNGSVKIAEVRSRFESSSGKVSLDEFVAQLGLLGFECKKVDRSNKMFILMELKKSGKVPDKSVDVKIKPCIYKRR